ncbi:hypothetical protein [Povalibacter sp.]|uniref:hypothetical protein n=1 Tax=Povalibacter sp. TaxID=1962978 RepID=UPI002F41195A
MEWSCVRTSSAQVSSAIAADRMHRNVISVVLQHWKIPRKLDPLAGSLHQRLHCLDVRCLVADPWRCVITLSSRMARRATQGLPLQREPLHVAHLLDQLRRYITRLPGPHRAALEQLLTSGNRINPTTLDLPPLQVTYLTQARALMRCERESDDNDCDGKRDSTNTLFPPLNEAKSAAFWTLHYGALGYFEREEFAHWLRHSPVHVRELLLACIDDVLLGML